MAVPASDDDEIGLDLGEAVAGCSLYDFTADRDRLLADQAPCPGNFAPDQSQRCGVVVTAFEACNV
jgi:hypothetical protein